MVGLWVELLIIQTLVGYCFVIANDLIGIYNIKDLNEMKGDLTFVKYHKLFGRIEISIFYIITIQCLYMLWAHMSVNDPNLYRPSGVWAHSWIGGFLALVLVSIKLFIARWKKDQIYKYGHIVGPVGFIGWSLSHWTSLYNFYFVVLPSSGTTTIIAPNNFIWAAIFPFIVGACLFMYVMIKRGVGRKERGRFAFNQIAFILHGITFGYEKSAKELMGTPALFKYVVPKTYEFIEKMMTMSGFDIRKLEQMSIPDAMKEFMTMAAKVGMAEKIKIKWESDTTFTVESVNCSTAAVRSVMTPEELTNAICPWALFTASIVNKITGKELRFEPSEFNEIGAITRLSIIDTPKSS
jgi:hypothetical protein